MVRLSVEDKNKIVQFLLGAYRVGPSSTTWQIQEIVALYGVTRKTVSSLWSATKKQIMDNGALQFTCPRTRLQYKKNVVVYHAKIKSIPFKDRTTIIKFASKLNVSKSQVGMWVKEKHIRPHTS